MDEGLLRKKHFRINELVEKNKEKQIESDSESDEEIKNYKSLISGKINIKNVLSQINRGSEIEDKVVKKVENDNKNNLKIKSVLDMLPQPKRNLADKNSNKINPEKSLFNSVNDEKLRNLINPDSIYSTDKTSYESKQQYLSEFNVNDHIDKNWEMNYLTRLQQSETYEDVINAPDTIKNKNNIKPVITDYQKQKMKNELDSLVNIQSKYSTKISTNDKYGWGMSKKFKNKK
jgi:hypothetical protein